MLKCINRRIHFPFFSTPPNRIKESGEWKAFFLHRHMLMCSVMAVAVAAAAGVSGDRRNEWTMDANDSIRGSEAKNFKHKLPALRIRKRIYLIDLIDSAYKMEHSNFLFFVHTSIMLRGINGDGSSGNILGRLTMANTQTHNRNRLSGARGTHFIAKCETDGDGDGSS